MQIAVRDISGKEIKTITLPEAIYGVEMDEHVLHMAVKTYRANKRQGTHATKTKSFVSGGGKKPFKQKGTGQARQGSTRSPLQPGGGTLFGPQPRDYRNKANRKFRDLALKIALSDKVRAQKFVVVDDFKLSEYSTKQVIKILAALKVEKALLSDERKDNFLYKSASNIYGAGTVSPAELNAENVLRHGSLVMSETALNVIAHRLSEIAPDGKE